MKRLHVVFALCLGSLGGSSVGCGAAQMAPEPVKVVAVDCYQRPLAQDQCWTVVQFPNGERRAKLGRWGKVGEEFKASRTDERTLAGQPEGWR